MDFTLSDRAQDYQRRVGEFIRTQIEPIERGYHEQQRAQSDPWTVQPVVAELKAKARAAGLWNLFLPKGFDGPGLSNVEYAPLAELMGRSFLAPEIFNSNAPDTGNAEVLLHYGSDEQRAEWLEPLLRGEIRSAFCMTEPDVASSDATNMAATAIVDGDQIVLNGRKWWSTGVGHPNCEFVIFMGLTDPDAHKYLRHSMVLVPLDTPGVKVERMLPVFGRYDEPYGHGEVSFTDVRLPLSAVIAGPGRGFEIAQGRLGPGRIHHCMRLIGLAEHALELACRRATERTAFGKPLANLGGNRERLARARIAINQARLQVLHEGRAHHGRPHPVRFELGAHGLRQRDHPGLGDVVGGHAGQVHQSGHRGDVDDVSAALPFQQRHEGAAATDHAEQVDVQDPVPARACAARTSCWPTSLTS